ncbi:hypothetical protein B0H12DRAFT_1326937 [Mycena haematopus]|nr:hypothetical protein B0H12DRAFT_1326937 [Mycena haematopus]
MDESSTPEPLSTTRVFGDVAYWTLADLLPISNELDAVLHFGGCLQCMIYFAHHVLRPVGSHSSGASRIQTISVPASRFYLHRRISALKGVPGAALLKHILDECVHLQVPVSRFDARTLQLHRARAGDGSVTDEKYWADWEVGDAALAPSRAVACYRADHSQYTRANWANPAIRTP